MVVKDFSLPLNLPSIGFFKVDNRKYRSENRVIKWRGQKTKIYLRDELLKTFFYFFEINCPDRVWLIYLNIS